MRKLRDSALLVALMLGAPVMASANPITLVGVNDPTLRASVLLSYSSSTATTGVLTLVIGNISTAYNPALTGFGFNAPASITSVTAFTSTLSPWGYSFTPDGINTPGNYGFFDIAGLTGPNLNGGKPSNGIQINNSATFTFTLAGTNLNLLDVNSFLLLNSSASNSTSSVQPFIARFQRTGPLGQDSDVATQVPEHSTILLSTSALAGLAWLRRRKK
jgi:hypothetical protein